MSFFDTESKTIEVEEHDKIIKALKNKHDDELRAIRIDRERDYRNSAHLLEDEKINHAHETANLKADNEIALKKKEHELLTVADKRVLEAEKRATVAETRVAVLEKEVEMSGKAEEVGAQVLDVKELVTGLINKLPTIDINNITVSSTPVSNKSDGANKQQSNSKDSNNPK